jgi:hypothetical protein
MLQINTPSTIVFNVDFVYILAYRLFYQYLITFCYIQHFCFLCIEISLLDEADIDGVHFQTSHVHANHNDRQLYAFFIVYYLGN